MKRLGLNSLISGVFLCLSLSILAQNASILDSIAHYRAQSLAATTLAEKEALNLLLVESVKTLLRKEDFLKQDLGIIDKNLAITRHSRPYFGMISWSLLYPNDSVSYHAHIVYREKKYERLYNLKNSSNSYPGAMETFDIRNWYGAIYYDAVPYKRDGDWHFIFLGWRSLDQQRQAKILESVSLEADEIYMGSPRVLLNLVPRGREFLEYSTDVRLNLKYDSKQDFIYFDNLVRSGGKLSPSFSFSAYHYDRKSEQWLLQTDVEINAAR